MPFPLDTQVFFPALLVVLPLLCAPACILIKDRNVSWAIAMLASWGSFFIAIGILLHVNGNGVLVHEFGNWAAPWGIEYRIDALNSFFILLVTGTAALSVTYGYESLRKELDHNLHHYFWGTFLLCLAGLLGVCATGDAFNAFVFLEISSLSTYILVALSRDRRGLYSAYQYLILGTIGATFFVIGVGLLYLVTGSLNLQDIAIHLGNATEARPKLAALAFIVVGITLKLALFPLHWWLPNAYASSPSVASSFLAASATKVAIYLLLRFCFDTFDQTRIFEGLPIGHLISIFSILAVVVGSAIAIFEKDIKRAFAYSSVSQIGFITMGIGLSTPEGFRATLLFVVAHAVTKGAVFMLLGCFSFRIGHRLTLSSIRGAAKNMPYTSGALVLAGLSLIGVPGTIGFLGKWSLVEAFIQSGNSYLAFFILVSSLLTVVYVWRIIGALYDSTNPVIGDAAGNAVRKEAPISMLVTTGVLVFLIVIWGLEASVPLAGAANAAALLTSHFW